MIDIVLVKWTDLTSSVSLHFTDTALPGSLKDLAAKHPKKPHNLSLIFSA